MKHLPRRLIFIGLIVLTFAIVFAVSNGQATTPPAEQPPNWDEISALVTAPAETFRGEYLANLPPPAEQNPCLHCHIAGEIYNEWSPTYRWLVWGGMWLTFVFGISRNFMVWRNRARWHDRWMLHLGRITAIVFILQASTGIILFFIPDTTTTILTQIVSIIQAIHWGSGIALFIAALGFSLGGALLPSYQRPFWALIFITGIIGGTLAIANLSFTYLYAEWHDPPPPSHLFILHMLLSPIAIAGIMNIYFMVLRKRGETA